MASQKSRNNFIYRIFRSSIYRLLFVFIVLIVLLSIMLPPFFSLNNILEITRANAIIGIAAIGLTIAMIAGCIDLSVASMIAAGGVILGVCIDAGFSIAISIILAVLVCILFGLVNGLLVTKLGIPAIVITIGTMSIIRGIAYITVYSLVGSGTVEISSNFLDFIGRGHILNIPVSVLIFAATAIIGFIFINFMTAGKKIYAIGGNIKVAYLSGINVNRYRIMVMIVSAFLASIGGILITSISGQAVPSVAEGYEIDILAGVVLGGTTFEGGKGSIQGTILGILILGIVGNAMIIINLNAYLQMVIKGLILLIALYLQKVK